MRNKELFKSIKRSDVIKAAVAAVLIMFFLLLNIGNQNTIEYKIQEETDSAIKKAAANIDGADKMWDPQISLPGGEYDFQITANGGGDVIAVASDGKELFREKVNGSQSIKVSLDKDYTEISLCTSQALTLTKLIVKSQHGSIFNDMYWLALLILAAFLYVVYLRLKSREDICEDKEKMYFALIAAAVLASYPLFTSYVYYGHDINFHLYRIEGIKDAILNGHPFAGIYPTHNNGYGYAAGVMYPDLFLYIPAVLRIFGISLPMAYKSLIAFVNVASALIMFYSVKHESKSNYAAFIASAVYTLSTWRAINLFSRGAMGEGLAMMFFPLVIVGLYHILKGDKSKWYVFAIGCSGVFCSHIISTVIAAVFIIVMLIVFIPNLLKDKRWLSLIKSGAAVLLLNLGWLVRFLQYYFGADLNIRHAGLDTQFVGHAVIPAELFNVFSQNSKFSQLLPGPIGDELSLTLGVAVGCLFIATLWYFVFKRGRLKEEKFELSSFVFAAVLIFASTTLFPWEMLQKNPAIALFVSTVRLPWRFLSLASALVCMTGAIVLVKAFKKFDKRIVTCVVLLICSLSFAVFGTAFTNDVSVILKTGYAPESSGMNGNEREYMRHGTDIAKLNADSYNSSSDIEIINTQKNGLDITVEISKKPGQNADSYIEVPLLYYPGYAAKTENGKRLEVTAGSNNVVKVNLDGAETTKVKVYYSGSISGTLAAIVSLFSWIAFLAYLIMRRRSRRGEASAEA